MHYVIINGSHKKPSQSHKIGKIVQYYIDQKLQLGYSSLIDLESLNLPFYSPDQKENPEFKQTWGEVEGMLQKAEGLVLITPEWDGMATPMLKNFLLTASTYTGLLAHKPALIITDSDSRGGAYPISDLRASGYKNNFLVYTPDHLIVRDVQNVFNSTEPLEGNNSDDFYHTKLIYSLNMLHEYAKALVHVRNSGVVDLENHKNGM
jgi:NAD(P)H-dependent FMN reductase